MTRYTSIKSKLSRLVSINTISPIDKKNIVSVDNFLSAYGLEKAGTTFWIKRQQASSVWAYSHVDTKPDLPKNDWLTDPHIMTEEGDRVYGLGISDAKFQLLNLLELSTRYPINIIVDGGEEIGDLEAANYVDQQRATDFIVVDGVTENYIPYDGMKGQLDGEIVFSSGLTAIHPGRDYRTLLYDSCKDLMEYIDITKLPINITGVYSEKRVRSLTLEEFTLRFDIRYSTEQSKYLYQFIDKYAPQIKQHYPPLVSAHHEVENSNLASFSSPLGKVITNIPRVRVVSGGLRDNGNHRPNEWIYPSQVEAHSQCLERVIEESILLNKAKQLSEVVV